MNYDSHNKVTAEIIQLLGRNTSSVSDLMVYTESILLGVIFLGERLHGAQPSTMLEMLELAINQAAVRHAQGGSKGVSL